MVSLSELELQNPELLTEAGGGAVERSLRYTWKKRVSLTRLIVF
jgi:hypothetical protein